MKKTLLIAIIGLISGSCDNSEDPYMKDNLAPEILVKKYLGEKYNTDFIDSLKIEKKRYTFSYKINDEEDNLTADISCSNESTTLNIDNNQITVTPVGIGKNIVNLETTDGFGVTVQTEVEIVAFDNLPPIAKLKVVESDKNLFLYERKLDASLSFDKDAKFGGKIIKYEYRVENEAIIRKKESFRYYIFPQKGTYKISLRVLDSNQVWSEMEVIRYTVK